MKGVNEMFTSKPLEKKTKSNLNKCYLLNSKNFSPIPGNQQFQFKLRFWTQRSRRLFRAQQKIADALAFQTNL